MGCPVSIRNKLKDIKNNISFFEIFHFDIFTQNCYISSFKEYNVKTGLERIWNSKTIS
jgi:hypothetical protein